MKQNDKFLTAIVIAIIVLVVGAFVVVLLTPEPEYRTQETPDAVVYNYLLALQKEDYGRALEYISSEVKNRPANAADMEWDVQQNMWQFDVVDQPAVTLVRTIISGDSATVTVNLAWNEGDFLGSGRSNGFTLRLKQEADGWKLVDGQTHWAEDWEWENE